MKNGTTHVQALLPEIHVGRGKSKREVARYYGYNDRKMVKGLLERERRKERKLEVGILDL